MRVKGRGDLLTKWLSPSPTKDATYAPRGGTLAPLPTPRGLTSALQATPRGGGASLPTPRGLKGALQSAIGAKTKATAAGGLGFEFARWP